MASAVKDLEQAPIVALDDHGVFLDGRPAGRAEGSDWKISDLHDQLITLKNNQRLLAPDRGPFNVILAADRDTPFDAVRRVLYTLNVAGIAHVHLTVKRAEPD